VIEEMAEIATEIETVEMIEDIDQIVIKTIEEIAGFLYIYFLIIFRDR
jgi:hypothetical protein